MAGRAPTRPAISSTPASLFESSGAQGANSPLPPAEPPVGPPSDGVTLLGGGCGCSGGVAAQSSARYYIIADPIVVEVALSGVGDELALVGCPQSSSSVSPLRATA
jgi:hypothetical protein